MNILQNISREYILAIVLIIGSVLKALGLEIENNAIEGLVTGIIAITIAILRYKKGDITLGGVKKV